MNIDAELLAADVARHLHGRRVGCAESITAGRIAANLACVEHATDFFRGGLVAYQTVTKRTLLNLSAPSVLSKRAAIEMAVGPARLLDVEAAVATTGLAGGDAECGVPVGTVIATNVDGVSNTGGHRGDMSGDAHTSSRACPSRCNVCSDVERSFRVRGRLWGEFERTHPR